MTTLRKSDEKKCEKYEHKKRRIKDENKNRATKRGIYCKEAEIDMDTSREG